MPGSTIEASFLEVEGRPASIREGTKQTTRVRFRGERGLFIKDESESNTVMMNFYSSEKHAKQIGSTLIGGQDKTK